MSAERGGHVVDVQQVIERVPSWEGKEVGLSLLKGGLSHLTYRADVDGESYVIRILRRDISDVLLGVESDFEIENTILAAETGVGPGVVASFPDLPALVLEHIDGPTFHLEDVRNPVNIPRIGRACRRLHDRARPFVNEFDIFRQLDGFLDICRRNDLDIPDGYESYLPTVARIESVVKTNAPPPVSCHNDLLAENFMDDGEIRIVDYQLSGLHDCCFELGDVAAESDYTPDDVELLCESYFGERLPLQVARTRLYLIVSNVTWTLWFSVHKGMLEPNPDVDFDYWEEALDKWGQAVRDMEGEDFGHLLERAAAG
jgi:thiamine kinase-like enzyme